MTRPVIAIVDGDWVFQRSVQEGLDAAGYFTIIWPDDAQASEWLRREAPELIILDLDWGRVGTGLAILRLLRQDLATWALPVIVCSDDADYLRQHGPRLRGKGCLVLPKPFAMRDLVAMVRAAIGPGQPLEPPEPPPALAPSP